jgi:hypothetical protein
MGTRNVTRTLQGNAESETSNQICASIRRPADWEESDEEVILRPPLWHAMGKKVHASCCDSPSCASRAYIVQLVKPIQLSGVRLTNELVLCS